MSKKLERFLRKLGPMKYQCLTMVQGTISRSRQVGNTTGAVNMEARRIHASRAILETQTDDVFPFVQTHLRQFMMIPFSGVTRRCPKTGTCRGMPLET